MRTIFTLAKKDLLLLVREPAALFFILAFPVLFGLLFGFIFQGTGGGDSQIRIAVVDQDQTELSAGFVEQLESDGRLLIDESFESLELAREAVRQRQVVAVVVIEPGFADSVEGIMLGSGGAQIGGFVDEARMAEAGIVEGIVTAEAFEFVMGRFADPDALRASLGRGETLLEDETGLQAALLRQMITTGRSLIDASDGDGEEASGPFAGGGFQPVSVGLEPVTAQAESGPRSSFELTFPQASAWALLGCATGFGVSIAGDREKGIMRRLLVAPVSGWEVLGGKALACFVSCLAVLVFIQIIGMLFLGVRIDRPLMLVAALPAIAFAFVGLTIGLAATAKSEVVSDGFIRAVLLVMALVGGAGVPLAFIDYPVKYLSHVSPFSWAILALEGASFRAFGWEEAALPLGILLAIGVAGFTFAAVVARGWRGSA
ncbi:MAG: ABC transporter permease [Planctomycetota bacterium]